MRLMILNPDWGMTDKQMEQRCRFLSGYVGPETSLSMECLKETSVCLDSLTDAVYAGPEILRMAIEAENQGYDGIILYCFSDPVMEACRQNVSIPVIGGGQAACLMVPLVGYHGAVLVADEKRIPEKMVSLSRTGLSMDRILGYEAVAARGLDPFANHEEMLEQLIRAGRRALEHTRAQVLVLGCLSFLGMAGEMEQILGVPVIDSAVAAVSLCEGMVRQGLHSSRRAYPGKHGNDPE